MGKKPDVKKVKLIRGASFTIPGYKFVPQNWVTVPVEVAEKLKPSQSFKIEDVGDVDDEVEENDGDEGGEGNDAPAKPPRKSKRGKRR